MKRFFDHIDLDRIPTDSVAIDDDLKLFTIDNLADKSLHNEPRKLTHAVIVMCTSGHCRLKINLKEYEVESPQLITLMPGQIIEPMGHSHNIKGYAISLSKRFIDILNLPGWQRQYMVNNPVVDIDSDKLTAIHFFYAILYRAAENTANPFRLQVIENLIRVFYYGGVSSLDSKECNEHIYKNSVVERFFELVQEHYREERLIGFYADKLCITPKYLSVVIKKISGYSPAEWLNRKVILYAKTLLTNSDMTVQQISAELHFPNPSFFGQYFKRHEGITPKQYRNQNRKS